jgi:hypothetical protein
MVSIARPMYCELRYIKPNVRVSELSPEKRAYCTSVLGTDIPSVIVMDREDEPLNNERIVVLSNDMRHVMNQFHIELSVFFNKVDALLDIKRSAILDNVNFVVETYFDMYRNFDMRSKICYRTIERAIKLFTGDANDTYMHVLSYVVDERAFSSIRFIRDAVRGRRKSSSHRISYPIDTCLRHCSVIKKNAKKLSTDFSAFGVEFTRFSLTAKNMR